jgi:hypothetical protein
LFYKSKFKIKLFLPKFDDALLHKVIYTASAKYLEIAEEKY